MLLESIHHYWIFLHLISAIFVFQISNDIFSIPIDVPTEIDLPQVLNQTTTSVAENCQDHQRAFEKRLGSRGVPTRHEALWNRKGQKGRRFRQWKTNPTIEIFFDCIHIMINSMCDLFVALSISEQLKCGSSPMNLAIHGPSIVPHFVGISFKIEGQRVKQVKPLAG